MLALYLKIESDVVKKIQADCPLDTDRAKLRLFQYWVNSDLNASWKRVTTALEKLDRRDLAKTISDKMKGESMTH